MRGREADTSLNGIFFIHPPELVDRILSQFEEIDICYSSIPLHDVDQSLSQLFFSYLHRSVISPTCECKINRLPLWHGPARRSSKTYRFGSVADSTIYTIIQRQCMGERDRGMEERENQIRGNRWRKQNRLRYSQYLLLERKLEF